MWLFFRDLLLSCIITLGWTLMFNVPRRYVIYCLILTFFGYGCKSALHQHGVHLAPATFCGSMLASFTGVYFSKRLIIPPKALIIPSLICLMPGIAAYKAMVAVVRISYEGFNIVLFGDMINRSFEAVFVAGALVLGLSIPSTVIYRRKPIV